MILGIDSVIGPSSSQIRSNHDPAPKTETKQPKKSKKQTAKKLAVYSRESHDASNTVVSLWSAIVVLMSIRGSSTNEKVQESLERATTYLKRAAKLLSDNVS